MTISPLAGKPAEASLLINVPRLITAYYTGRPNPSIPAERVAFGTSGHRGSALDNSFNEAHNPTTREWYEELSVAERKNFWSYLKSSQCGTARISWELLRLAWSSVAALAIAPLQDVLNLGAEARMNVPGRAEGNWRWRCTKEVLSAAEFSALRELTKSTTRMGIL